jgi:hypothetical protein
LGGDRVLCGLVDLLLDVLDLLAVGLLSLVVFGVAGHLGSLPQSGLCVDHRLAVL